MKKTFLKVSDHSRESTADHYTMARNIFDTFYGIFDDKDEDGGAGRLKAVACSFYYTMAVFCNGNLCW